jgi:hypothetical protein
MPTFPVLLISSLPAPFRFHEVLPEHFSSLKTRKVVSNESPPPHD